MTRTVGLAEAGKLRLSVSVWGVFGFAIRLLVLPASVWTAIGPYARRFSTVCSDDVVLLSCDLVRLPMLVDAMRVCAKMPIAVLCRSGLSGRSTSHVCGIPYTAECPFAALRCL